MGEFKLDQHDLDAEVGRMLRELWGLHRRGVGAHGDKWFAWTDEGLLQTGLHDSPHAALAALQALAAAVKE